MCIRSLKEILQRFLRGADAPAVRWLVEWIGVIRKIRRDYRGWHGRTPRLLMPVRYTEKIQWRKLFDLNPLHTILSDKLAVRNFIAECLGPDLLVPLLWSGENPDDIPFASLPRPYIIKSTHASGHTILVGPHGPVDAEKIKATAREWLSHCHGTSHREPGYVQVPRRLMVESLVETDNGTPPLERRFFVFDGRVRVINTVVVENGQIRNGAFHTPDWQALSWHFTRAPSATPFALPEQLDLMLDSAQRVGADFDHVRVDFYDTGYQIRIGEISLYSWSGSAAFKPDEADYILGSYWKIRHPFFRAWATMLQGRENIPSAERATRLSQAVGPGDAPWLPTEGLRK